MGIFFFLVLFSYGAFLVLGFYALQSGNSILKLIIRAAFLGFLFVFVFGLSISHEDAGLAAMVSGPLLGPLEMAYALFVYPATSFLALAISIGSVTGISLFVIFVVATKSRGWMPAFGIVILAFGVTLVASEISTRRLISKVAIECSGLNPSISIRPVLMMALDGSYSDPHAVLMHDGAEWHWSFKQKSFFYAEYDPISLKKNILYWCPSLLASEG
jgi:hypothetical protein